MKEIYPVRVEWLDSASHSPWTAAQDVAGLQVAVCVTVGLLLESDEKRAIIAQSWADDNSEAGNIIVIPTVAILLVQELAAKVPDVPNPLPKSKRAPRKVAA